MPVGKPVVVVGSINTDLVAVAERIPQAGETIRGDDFQVHPGGKGANQAVAVARLDYPVRMIGRLGEDAFGAQLRSNLEGAGVDCAGVKTSEGASGVAIIVVSSRGENCIVITPGANAKVTPADIEENLEILRGAGIVLVQLEIPLDTVEHLAMICGREGVPLILDPAPALELPHSIAKNVTWFTPNQTEAAFYTKRDGVNLNSTGSAEMANVILDKGYAGVILKLGPEGAYLATKGAHGAHIPAFTVRAVDTTAAGDAFNGGFAAGLMLGKTPEESALFAGGVAGISVTRRGAQPSMPTRAEVEAFLENELSRKANL